jgi:hypothetical protein
MDAGHAISNEKETGASGRACGNSQWFIDLLQRLGHEVWIGDATQIRASFVRRQPGGGAGRRMRPSATGLRRWGEDKPDR